jgi:hypothetical protein
LAVDEHEGVALLKESINLPIDTLDNPVRLIGELFLLDDIIQSLFEI